MSARLPGHPLAHRQALASDRARPFTLALLAIFMLAMLLALLLGTQVYRSLDDRRAETDARRLAYGTLVNAVKANDALDAVSVEHAGASDTLSMVQRTASGDFVTRLFVEDGELMQSYAAVETPSDSIVAHGLFSTDTFVVSYERGLLVLKTDPVTVSVALECVQPSLEGGAVVGGEGGTA